MQVMGVLQRGSHTMEFAETRGVGRGGRGLEGAMLSTTVAPTAAVTVACCCKSNCWVSQQPIHLPFLGIGTDRVENEHLTVHRCTRCITPMWINVSYVSHIMWMKLVSIIIMVDTIIIIMVVALINRNKVDHRKAKTVSSVKYGYRFNRSCVTRARVFPTLQHGTAKVTNKK